MKRVLAFTFILAVAGGSLSAAELAGVSLQDSITVDGTRLTLNGIGLRTKFMVKVYVAGLYLEKPASDAAAIISSDQMRRVEMVMMRDLGRGKITEAVEAGFEKNNEARMPALKARLDRFNSGIADLKEGDRLTITYAPGRGTTLSSRSGKTMTIEGKDFADALFSVWLGSYPVDEDLKAGMLGN